MRSAYHSDAEIHPTTLGTRPSRSLPCERDAAFPGSFSTLHAPLFSPRARHRLIRRHPKRPTDQVARIPDRITVGIQVPHPRARPEQAQLGLAIPGPVSHYLLIRRQPKCPDFIRRYPIPFAVTVVVDDPAIGACTVHPNLALAIARPISDYWPVASNPKRSLT